MLLLDPQLSSTGDGTLSSACDEPFQCESGVCRDGRCTQACGAVTCPEGATCGADGYCDFLSPLAKPELQVGMLYVGPVGDHGWTRAHDDSRAFFTGQLPNTSAMFCSFSACR